MRRQGWLVLIGLSLSGCSDQAVVQGQDAIRATLKDPTSAQFEGVKRCGQSTIISGNVNAKNTFGGYVGKEVFVARGTEGAIMGADDGREIFIKLMRECTKATMAENKRVYGS